MKSTKISPFPNATSEAYQKLSDDPDLFPLILEMEKLVDKYVGKYISESCIELLVPRHDPIFWTLLVRRSLELPVKDVVKYSLQIGTEVSELLESEADIWKNPKWCRVSFVLEALPTLGALTTKESKHAF